ncbi:hypothetical protein [Corynebacterium lubricantis]|uniref:hypothetical protein n=1 Tax=Corynebacterium lubricantis TaxID=541095 RepID=UPI0003798FF9|nr:hypothetical protein [Corynebacterium lubricantis]
MSTKELLLQAEILIQELRDTGDDNYFVEAKAARNGFPEIETTLSAFGNSPKAG